ncbi:effector-associated constant component EACC1 [Streptomyces sp. NPDC001135]
MEKYGASETPSARWRLHLRLQVSAEPGVGTGTYLGSLRDWLAAEEALRGRVELLARTPQPGRTGAAPDVLAVALGSGGAGAVPAQSVSAWLVQRRADVTVHVSRSDEREVTVEVRRTSEPQVVIGTVGQLLGGEEE